MMEVGLEDDFPYFHLGQIVSFNLSWYTNIANIECLGYLSELKL